MSHTPGPWEATRLEPDGFLIRQYGWEIRTPAWDVTTWIEHGAPIRKEEDAHLIAAAPDLLEAAEMACNVLAAINLREPEWLGVPMAILKLQAAIAKVEGESNA